MRGVGTRGGSRTRARAGSAVATASLMSWTTGAFFFVGGLLAATVAALTGDGVGNRAIVFGVALIAVLTGILLYSMGERMPVRAHPILVSLGTVLITVAIHWL